MRGMKYLLLLLASARVASAQDWNDERTMRLAHLGTALRAAQLADTGLRDYKAQAHGYLTFLAQLGEGFPEPPKVLKSDELVLEVYWRAPNLSKQRIVGRRDTLLLPTDINYHADHLGIVQNNFANVIRVGDGDEVRDVPHPLSGTGLAEYDYAISDSLTIDLGDRQLNVYEVRFRPKRDREPRAVGAVYLDRETGQVARMTFGFTRAALIDKELEDVTIVLDNGLVGGRFWLPRRQSVEIRRTGTWLEYPARGIIRGRWEISSIETNVGLPETIFAGPEIVTMPQSVVRAYPFKGRIVDSLPSDVRAATDEDVKKVQEDARRLVRAQALERARTGSLAIRSVSDVARFNRMEGLALGFGVRQRLGGGLSVLARGRFGLADHEFKGTLSPVFETSSGVSLSASVYRELIPVGDVQERSTVVNSIAAQEFGSDATEAFRARGVGLRLEWGAPGAVRTRIGANWDWREEPAAVRAVPATGTFRDTPQVQVGGGVRLFAGLIAPERALNAAGTLLRFAGEATLGSDERHGYARVASQATVTQPLQTGSVVLWAFGAGVGKVSTGNEPLPLCISNCAGRDVPAQAFVYLGGPVTGPGYGMHEFVTRYGGAAHLEWRLPVPAPSIPLGRFGRSGGRATLAPFAHGIVAGTPDGPPYRIYPSLGVGGLFLFDLLRMDVARGLRGGRWTFSVDVNQAFWSIL